MVASFIGQRGLLLFCLRMVPLRDLHSREHIAVLASTSTFRVADAVKPPQSASRFVLVTSPQEARYKKWAKAPDVEKLGMPIWDEMELMRLWELRFSSVPEPDWRAYYDRWGGVPRSVLEKTSSHYQELLDRRSGQWISIHA